eukprot:272249-Pleurochrysis_carterae.AAC.1
MIDYGIEAEQHSWSNTWQEFLKYAQKKDIGRTADENGGMDQQKEEKRTREPHPTLYPGEVEGDEEERPGHQRRNINGLTDRAKANLHKQERREDTYKNKKIRLVEGGNGIRR